MKNYLLHIVLLFLLSFSVLAQEKNIRERVYLHLNTRSFLVGETLYFSAYNNSDLTGQPSPLSSVLYVELIGKEGPVIQQKIKLHNGRGQGDFFLSSLLPTGNYQLVAHTRWMKNFDDYFQETITLINPFERYKVPVKSDTKIDLQLFPTGGKLISGIENIIGYTISPRETAGLKGKILDETGTTMTTFEPNAKGFGHFKFTPKEGMSYRVLLEDSSGTFYFFEVPGTVAEGGVISIIRTPKTHEVSVQGSNFERGKLLIENSQGQILLEYPVQPGNTIAIDHDNLRDALYLIRLINQQEIEMSTRWFYKGNISAAREQVSNTFDSRQKVEIPVSLPEGDYSVSVRKKSKYLSDSPIKAVSSPFWYHFDKITPLKKDDFLSFPPDILEDILLIQQGKLWNTTTDSVLYLPELRSELLEGRITDRDGLPREGVTTTLSFPIIPYQIRSSISDNTGKILFDFIGPNENTDAFIQALNVDYPHTIEVTNNWKLTSPPFDYNIPTLDSLQIQEIIEKSVRVQIENAYRNQLIDSLKPANQWHEQFKPYDSYYILDDYNRFPTVRDHFVEYILGARVRKEKFIINHRYYYNNFNEPHLIMVDGVPVRDSIILAYSPYKFKSIGLINNRYYLGATVFDGVLNFETFEGGLKEMRLDDNVLKIPVIGVSASKEYHFPNYSSLNNPRIPDQRDQLYWNPTVTPVEGQTIITFFTSDVKGIHEIIVEGFTSEGKPLSLIKNFEVK